MAKKAKLLGLAAVSAAMLAMPALASAQTAHIDATSTFTVTGGASTINETGGLTFSGTSIDGAGAFTSTTTGKLLMTLTGVNESVFGSKCASTAQGHAGSSGVVTTSELTFHLIMLATNKPGILITPNAAGIFLHYNCLGVERTVTAMDSWEQSPLRPAA